MTLFIAKGAVRSFQHIASYLHYFEEVYGMKEAQNHLSPCQKFQCCITYLISWYCLVTWYIYVLS